MGQRVERKKRSRIAPAPRESKEMTRRSFRLGDHAVFSAQIGSRQSLSGSLDALGRGVGAGSLVHLDVQINGLISIVVVPLAVAPIIIDVTIFRFA